MKCRVQAKTDRRRVGPEEVLVVIRTRDEPGVVKHDYYLSNAPTETELCEFGRVATAEHRIEEWIERGKSETGLADYRSSRLAGLVPPSDSFVDCIVVHRVGNAAGKKIHTGDDVSADSRRDREIVPLRLSMRGSHAHRSRTNSPFGAQSTGAILPSQTT